MSFIFKSNEEFVQALKTNTVLQEEMRKDPLDAMNKITILDEVPDTKVYRNVVTALMITVLLIVSGLITMALRNMAETNQTILSIFNSIASTAIGALAGVLVPTQKKG